MTTANFCLTSQPPTARVNDSGRPPLFAFQTATAPRGGLLRVVELEPLEHRIFRQIEALRDLPEGWDSYGGRPPSEATIQAAVHFFAQLAELGRSISIPIPLPKVMAAGDGTVGFVWTAAGRGALEVEIGSELAQYVSSRDGVVTEGRIQGPMDLLPELFRLLPPNE